MEKTKYIDLTSDYGFKRVFSSEPNKDLLIDFISALFNGRKIVEDLTYAKNEYVGDTDEMGTVILDLLCTGSDECFLSENTELPMLYMGDAIRATLELMDAPAENLRVRSSYNLGGLSFAPKDVAESIRQEISSFEIGYTENDPRQTIADSWPKSIEDTYAQEDWGWKPKFALQDVTKVMLENLTPAAQK